MTMSRHFLEPLLRADSGGLRLVNERDGSIVAHELELAAESRARNRGLLGRSGLASGAAMIIAPCNAVHTFFMRFTIDVVFASRDGHVVKLRRNLTPWRIGIGLGAFATVELAAGSIDRCEIRQGDRLRIISDVHPTERPA